MSQTIMDEKKPTSESCPGEEAEGVVGGWVDVGPGNHLARTEGIFHSSPVLGVSATLGECLGGYAEVPLLTLL